MSKESFSAYRLHKESLQKNKHEMSADTFKDENEIVAEARFILSDINKKSWNNFLGRIGEIDDEQVDLVVSSLEGHVDELESRQLRKLELSRETLKKLLADVELGSAEKVEMGLVRSLELQDVSFMTRDISKILDNPFFKKVVNVDLSNASLSAENLYAITTSEKMKYAQSIDLGGNDIGVRGIGLIASSHALTNVQNLDITNNEGLEAEELEKLILSERLPSLRFIRCHISMDENEKKRIDALARQKKIEIRQY